MDHAFRVFMKNGATFTTNELPKDILARMGGEVKKIKKNKGPVEVNHNRDTETAMAAAFRKAQSHGG